MRARGQSLIEVVVAVGILSVALIGVMAGVTAGLKGARISRERSYARLLADRKIESLRVSRAEDPTAFFVARATETEIDETPPGYTATTRYTLQQGGNRMFISVEVTWEDGENEYSVNQETYLSRY